MALTNHSSHQYKRTGSKIPDKYWSEAPPVEDAPEPLLHRVSALCISSTCSSSDNSCGPSDLHHAAGMKRYAEPLKPSSEHRPIFIYRLRPNHCRARFYCIYSCRCKATFTFSKLYLFIKNSDPFRRALNVNRVVNRSRHWSGWPTFLFLYEPYLVSSEIQVFMFVS